MMKKIERLDRWFWEADTFWGLVRSLSMTVALYLIIYYFEELADWVELIFNLERSPPTPPSKIEWHRLMAAMVSLVCAVGAIYNYLLCVQARRRKSAELKRLNAQLDRELAEQDQS